MSIWSAIADSKKIVNYEQALGVKDITSSEMRRAIQEWYALYYDSIPTKDEDPSPKLPVAIVSRLYKAIFSEYKAVATDSVDSEFIAQILLALDKKRKFAVQQMLIGGLCLIKPIPIANGFHFSIIDRQNMLIFSRDGDGNITDMGTMECTQIGRTVYTLLERRTVDTAGYLTIESRLFEAETEGVLGVEVPLNTLDKYAQLIPVLRYTVPIHSIGLIPLYCPQENCIDGSLDRVSVYAAATGLIHTVNRNEARLNREFELGRLRLSVPDTMLRGSCDDGTQGLYDDIFTPAPIADVDGNAGIVPFAPTLREQSFIARKKEALRDIESLIGMKRGTLSDVETAEKTATEITSSAGEYNLTIQDFQEQWESCAREVVRVCDVLGRIYHIKDNTVIDSTQDISISWGNGILYDEDKEWATLMQLVSAGMLKPEIALAWKFDLPWDKPGEIEYIRKRYMPQEDAGVADEDDV